MGIFGDACAQFVVSWYQVLKLDRPITHVRNSLRLIEERIAVAAFMPASLKYFYLMPGHGELLWDIYGAYIEHLLLVRQQPVGPSLEILDHILAQADPDFVFIGMLVTHLLMSKLRQFYPSP